MAQRLFLLCGLPFSGKSTMGRTLAERTGITHVEVDRIVAERRPSDVGRVSREEWIAAYRVGYGLVEEALVRGESVVFDAVSYRRLQRYRIERIADRCRVPMTVIYLDVSPDEALRRRDANALAPVRPHVPSDDFDEVRAGMQPPGPDETAVRYRPAESLNDWIDREIVPLLRMGLTMESAEARTASASG